LQQNHPQKLIDAAGSGQRSLFAAAAAYDL
jgi:hypothetical protein